MSVGMVACVSSAVTKRLRCVDFVGWQRLVLDVSFRHVARVNQRDDGTNGHVSLLRVLAVTLSWVGSVHVGGDAYRVCLVW